MADVLVSNLASNLPAGITLDADYVTSTSAMQVVTDVLEAYLAAQAAVNDGVAAGERVAALTANTGAEQTIERPTGTFVTVRPRVYTFISLQKLAATAQYAPLA